MISEDTHQKILNLDPKIRFSGVVNNKSEILASHSPEGTERLLTDDEVKMSIHYTLERFEKTSNLSYKIGEEKSSIIQYEKVTLITIPLNKKEFLLLSTEPDANYLDIIANVFGLIS